MTYSPIHGPGHPPALMQGRVYSSKVMKGEICLPKFEYDLLPVLNKEDFAATRIGKSTMYRYKYAPLSSHRLKDQSDIVDFHYNEFLDYVSLFVELFDDVPATCTLLEDDQEYLQEAFEVALTTMSLNISDWILERQFGDFYTVRRIEEDNAN